MTLALEHCIRQSLDAMVKANKGRLVGPPQAFDAHPHEIRLKRFNPLPSQRPHQASPREPIPKPKRTQLVFGDELSAYDLVARKIINAVSERSGLTVGLIISPSRKYTNAYWRHLAIALIRKHTELSAQQIGQIFSRDHSTILHAVKRGNESKPEDIATVEAMLAEADRHA